jgi:hypothetical protein
MSHNQNKHNHDKKPDDLPKWVTRLTRLIEKHWQHHGPCKSINYKTYYDPDYQCWQIYAAPAYQEIYGSEDDGKQVWTGFIFEAGEFSRESGIWVQDFAVASQCSACTPYPKMMFKGKYRGHSVFVHILLEPDKNTPSVEVLDTIKQEVRLKDE